MLEGTAWKKSTDIIGPAGIWRTCGFSRTWRVHLNLMVIMFSDSVPCDAGGHKNPRTWLTPGWTSFCRGHQRTSGGHEPASKLQYKKLRLRLKNFFMQLLQNAPSLIWTQTTTFLYFFNRPRACFCLSAKLGRERKRAKNFWLASNCFVTAFANDILLPAWG